MTATAAALEAIARLGAAHGPLELFQSGGCCDGSSPICLLKDELPVAAGDVLLGAPGGVPFYIDADMYERWGRPDFVLDVAPGPPEGFSLGPEDAHFVVRSGAATCRAAP
ncbi:MAG TPA: DUF779 domain-containing protein [Solirubrobacteraceae bacterium]|nr:DUF779 domain-containing protein [Solirubrobacteraceae bacterium]